MYYLRSKTVGSPPVCFASAGVDEIRSTGHQYIKTCGYEVIVDGRIKHGRYGFRITHDVNKLHASTFDERTSVRDWTNVLTKFTISRHYIGILTLTLYANDAGHLERRPDHFVC